TTGTLGFLKLSVTDKRNAQNQLSRLTRTLAVDLRDPNGDGRLTPAEVIAAPVTTLSTTLDAQADVNLVLKASLAGLTATPSLTSDFHLVWRLNPQTAAESFDVGFGAIRVDLGEIISRVVEPVRQLVSNAVRPIRPILTALETPIPGI